MPILWSPPMPISPRIEQLDHAELLTAARTVQEPATLTFIAEALGSVAEKDAVPVLLALLQHPSALVREGAVYGIRQFIQRNDVFDALKSIATNDPSNGVREAATETVEGAW